MKLFKENQKGFAFIDLLIVVGVLTFLLVITVVAITPAKKYAQANDTKRRNDVNTILNAVNQYMADNTGTVPTGIIGVVQNVSDAGADICAILVPQYVAALPVDPNINNGASIADCATVGYNTGYTIVQSATNGRITVGATAEIAGKVISVTR